MVSPAIQAQARALDRPRWWNQDDPDVAARLMQDVAISLEVWAHQRRFVNLAFARMASGRDLPTVYGLSMSRSASGLGGLAAEALNFRSPTFNLIGSAIETLVNKLGRNRIWVKYLTDGGDYKTRLACSKAEDYVEGLFYGAHVHREMKQCLQDALTWGTAFAKIHNADPDPKRICFERVISDEILVDDAEAIYGKPRSLYQRNFVHKQQLAELYLERGAPGDQGAKRRAEIAAAIWRAGTSVPGIVHLQTSNYSDMVPLVEGWHLGGGKRSHLVGIGTIALNPAELQEWTKSGFPFAVLRYNNLGFGYWGQGLAEVLAPHQKKINRLNEIIDEAQKRIAVPRVVIDTGSGVTADMLANTIGGVIKKKPGSPSPEWILPPAVQPEIYQDREQEIAKGYRRAGISEDSAAGESSDKVRSGAAEDIRDDIKSQRFVCTGQALEDFGVDIADLMMDMACDIKPQVTVSGRRDPIKWQDVKDALESARAKAFPISSFSTSPEARLKQADRMLAAGQVSREDYLRVIDYPDVKAFTDLSVASANNIERTLSDMLESGDYRGPDRYMDVQLAFATAHARYEFERAHGTPDDALEVLRIFIDQCDTLIQSGNAAPAPAPQQSIVASGAGGLEAQSTSGPPPGPMPGAAAPPPSGAMGAGAMAASPAGALQ